MKRRQLLAMAVVLSSAAAGCKGKSESQSAAPPAPVDAVRLAAWPLPMSEGPEISSHRIFAAARGPGGALWFATRNALSRFDPKTRAFTNTTFKEDIETFLVDPEGVIWIGASEGLLRFDPSTRASTLFTMEHGLPGRTVTALFRDKEGTLWCAAETTGTPTMGVAKLDPKTRVFTALTDKDDPIPAALPKYQDSQGALWLQAYPSVMRVDPKTREIKKYPSGTSDGSGVPGGIVMMAEDADGGLWFGTYHGAARLDPKTQAFTTFTAKEGLADKQIRAIAKDSEGAMWLGTPKGLSRFDPKTQAFTTLTRKDGLADDDVQTLTADTEGALWIGTNGGGISRLDVKTRAFTTFTPRGDHEGLSTYAIGRDAEGALWLGAIGWGASAHKLDPKTGTWTAYSAREGLKDVVINAFFLDGGGALWAEGFRFNPKTGTFEGVLDSVDIPAKVTGNELWFGTWSGVKRADLRTGEVNIHYKPDDGLAGSYVKAVAVDAEGGVWVGMDEGASRIDPKSKTVATWKARDGLVGKNISAAFVDKDSTVWLGTDKGLCELDPKARKFTCLTERDGLVGAPVEDIAQDDGGALWIGTDKGASKLDLQSRAFTSYTKEDGLAHDAIVTVAQAPDKAIWLGSMRGAARLVLADPDEAGLFTTTKPQAPRLAVSGSTVAFTRPTGLSIVDVSAPDQPKLAALPSFPAGADITALAPGPQGAVWAGTQLSGLVLRRAGKDGKDIAVTKAQGLPSMTITAVAPLPGSSNTRVWVGTGGGPAIVSIAGESLAVERVRWDDMPTGPVSALAVAEDGSAFIGYSALPAKRFLDPKLAARRAKTRVLHVSAKGLTAEIPAGDALGGQVLTALAYDGKRGVWAGTSRGLFLSAKGGDGKMAGFSREALPSGDPPLSVRRLEVAPDAARTLWIAADRRGDVPPQIVGYRPEAKWLSPLGREQGLPEGAAVDDIAVDEAGYLVALVGETLARGQVFIVGR